MRPPAGGTLRGQQMIIENDRGRNACYEIESVERDGELYKVCLGDVSFIRGFQDNKNYSKGYVYNFAEGAGFIIPNAVYFASLDDGPSALHSTMVPVTVSRAAP